VGVQFFVLFSYIEQIARLNRTVGMDEGVIALLVEHLNAIGIEIDSPPLTNLTDSGELLPASLRRGQMRNPYWLTYQPDMTFTEISQIVRRRHGDRPLLVLGERISERSANSFRGAGVQYLDAAGNTYIAFGDVLIDIRGRRHPVSRSKLESPGRSANLFSPRRARVVFAIVTWPHLARASIREIAAVAGVSPGLAHESLDLLEKNGYLRSGYSRELRDGNDLLDHWVASYPSGLAPTLGLAEFAGDIEGVRPVRPDEPIYVSGESAVPRMIRPTSLTVYVEDLDPKLAIVNRWRSDGPPNISVRQKFWTDPSEPEERSALPLQVPWTLAYADLMATGEARQRAAARQLREDSAAIRQD
jgi:hypothetical protein